MARKPKPIPKGYHTVTPYLIVNDAAAAMDFYHRAFDATESFRFTDPAGKVRHAEIKIGDSVLMLVDEFPEFPNMLGPKARGGATLHLYLYVEDVDALFAQALAAGATVRNPLQNHYYGDRSGGVEDPFGHVWFLASHVEDVSPAELKRRAALAGR